MALEAHAVRRTISNVYGLVHTMFRDALVDELIEDNPCMLHRGELPEETDKDPEWRASATYTAREVEQLMGARGDHGGAAFAPGHIGDGQTSRWNDRITSPPS